MGMMKTTLDLPDDLVKEIKLRAVHEGKKLKDAMAELLRRGLSMPAGSSATIVKVNQATLNRRTEMTRKFVSGEWGVELEGFEQGQETDRRKELQREDAWRA